MQAGTYVSRRYAVLVNRPHQCYTKYRNYEDGEGGESNDADVAPEFHLILSHIA